jgi:Zn-dependent peptidase ImmA (M78 family)
MSTANQIYSNAAELLRDMRDRGVAVEVPIDVDAIAEALGISVESDFSLEEEDIIGEISFEGHSPIVRINPKQNSYEPCRRFTLAHEIGHYCLHRSKSRRGFVDSQETMSRTASYWDTLESEANNFAAQLLMPKALMLSESQNVIDGYRKRNKVPSMPSSEFVQEMASRFQVSNKAMEYRLQSLDIVKRSKSPTSL